MCVVLKPLAMEERLTNLISDSILPRLIPDIEILPWRRNYVLAVQVHPSPGRPHYLKSVGLQGGVYVRVGSTNRRADRELIDELRRFARGETFDEQAMPECDSEALDFRAASESFARCVFEVHPPGCHPLKPGKMFSDKEKTKIRTHLDR